MACAVQDLLHEAVCGPLQGSTQQIMLAQATLLCQILNTLNPVANCDLQTMLDDVQCIRGAHTIQIEYVMAQLLCDIKDAIVNLANQPSCYAGSPEGKVVGQVCGQLVTDSTTGVLYKFLGTPGSMLGWQ